MKRATFRAWKCRQGVHRFTFTHNQCWVWPACKDCHRSGPNIGPSILPTDVSFKAGDIFAGLSLRFIKQWDIKADQSIPPLPVRP
jgi:hypothetical protein